MIAFTSQDITAAQANDLEAVSLITRAMMPVVDNIARSLARGHERYGSDLADELAAEGNLILWTLVRDHDGDERHGSDWLVGALRGLMFRARAQLLNPGMSRFAVETYLTCLKEEDNDVAKAVERAVSLPAGKRITRADAVAAQMACGHALSLDASINGGAKKKGTHQQQTLADTLADKPADDGHISEARKRRIRMTNEVLDGMAEIQALILRDIYMNRLTIDEVCDYTGRSWAQLRKRKSEARTTFHQRFDFETAYGDVKPALVKEK